MNVLYIEDNVINRRVIEIGLKSIGSIVTVENGFTGIEMAKAGSYDVIMIDLSLNDPDMDGFQVLEKLKIEAKIPALYIAVTAYVGDDWENKCIRAGFDWYVTKPIDLHDLTQKLKSLSPAD